MVERRIAVLVDGDNVSARHSRWIRSKAKKVGRIDISRAYACASCPSDWRSIPGYRLIHAGASKNAADLLLSIDAIELALVNDVKAFVIVTSDRDFTHIAERLRERGAYVLGLGEAKAPREFRMACTDFLVFDSPHLKSGPEHKDRGFSEFDEQIRNMIAKHSSGGRGLRICELAPKMHSAYRTQISTYPERTWRKYLSARPKLYELDPKGPEAMVRFRPAGFASA